MGRFLKFLALPNREQALLLQAMILLVFTRIGLRTLPFASLRYVLAKLAANKARIGIGAREEIIEQIIWAVDTVGRHLPLFGTCLTQALAAHVLLARHGQPSDLRIGVTRDSDGKFVAHAWLEKQGTILIGGGPSEHYTAMPALKGLEL